MESNTQLESDSKTSSEEESMDVQAGACRSYECVFCKRGFTTAQALGGHMNIHRKDRAKTSSQQSSIPSVASKVLDEPNYNYYSPPIQSFPQYCSVIQEVNSSSYIQTFFPAGSWGLERPPAVVEGGRDFSGCLNLIGEDWPATLSLRIGPSRVEIEEDDKKLQESSDDQDDDLDLELRLGHDP